MGKIISEHWVNADLEQVFAFFSDPHNLPRLMPNHMNVRLEDLRLVPPGHTNPREVVESGALPGNVVQSGEIATVIAGPGSLITISFRLVPFLPFRGRWVAEIVDYQALSSFVDLQREGPMRSWLHRHSFRNEVRNGSEGTIVRDEVEYELPFGFLGHLADALLIERMLRGTFSTRQKQLESFFPPR